MTKFAVYVAERRKVAQDIVSLKLVRADGQQLPPFSAGAHVDVSLPNGFVRQYSLCNGPGEYDHYEIAVLRALSSRGGSVYINEKVSVGDKLMISEPRNAFPLTHRDRTILVAGGIGVTPLLSMAKHLAVAGSDFTLHYCARSAAQAAFCADLRGTSFASRVHFHFDDGAPDQRLDLMQALGAPLPGVDGGTGLAPVLSIVRGALEGGMRNPIHLYFGVRSMQDLYDAQKLQALAERYSNLNVQVVVATGPAAPGLTGGLVTDAIERDHPHLKGWRAYLCGAPAMVEALELVVTRLGIEPSHIHADAFYSTGI